MLYQSYQLQDDMVAPLRLLAEWGRFLGLPDAIAFTDQHQQRLSALLEMVQRFRLTHSRPDFAIGKVHSNGREVAVREEVVLDLPFGKLLRFAKDEAPPQPRVLVVAPLSGHFSTLLRETVAVLLRDHEVFITDWANARDVPLQAGRFGVDDYTDYLIRFLETIGPDAHILAVCQPCVQALAAVSIMAEDKNPATPLSMTLMAGPIDTRESPTVVNKLASERTLSWFESRVLGRVPLRFPGAGRKVYPGFVQLTAFMTMNIDRHRQAHNKLYTLLAAGEEAEAEKIKRFYDEYFAVLDLTAEFYLETIERIFQRSELATGDYRHHGRKVNPAAIRRTALLTVEGGRDDICSIGQTAAAHDLCSALRPHLKRHHLQANVGHYGVFAGKRWESQIYPVVRNLILSME